MASQHCRGVTTLPQCHSTVKGLQHCQGITTLPWRHNTAMASQHCHGVIAPAEQQGTCMCVTLVEQWSTAIPVEQRSISHPNGAPRHAHVYFPSGAMEQQPPQ
eukprot:1144247-Pelagomonas_calceolata.AAC.2